MKLWKKILIAIFLGTGSGLLLGPNAEFLKPVGQVFLGLITMIIMPLVFASMTLGVTSINDPAKLGRVGIKTLFLYSTTTIIAIVIGISLAYGFDLGAGMELVPSGSIQIQKAPSLKDIFLDVIPSNPIASLAEGNVLQIIVFSLFLGIAINLAGPKGKPLLGVIESLAEVMYRLTAIVMEFSPIGVFALMAWVAGTFGINALLPLFKFLMVYYLGCALHMAGVFCGLLKFAARVSPWPFFRGMSDAMMMAFSTCSSSATLPISLHCATEKLGISKNIANFMLPLGTTINMNGAALYQGMSAVFIAKSFGIDLSTQALVSIVATATLASIGAAGIPGTGLIMLSIVFSSVGIPIEGLAILAGIDRVREMVSTVLNVTGDNICAILVSKQEGEFDEKRYYQNEAAVYTEVNT